jgi:hypothetical protein
MNTTEIQKTADGVFKEHPEAKSVFITSDGHAFLSKNSADLHKNTNHSKKKLEVIEVKNETFAASKTTEGVTEVKLSKMNKTLLTELAISKGIEVPEEATKAEIIALIEAVINAEIQE